MKTSFYPIILAGGRGTRFWPRSRKALPKQALALAGKRTMIQQTVERLRPLAPARRIWIIANHEVLSVLRKQLPKLERRQIIPEPAARNTAPAIGLAAFILLRQDPDAVLGLFPADHVIADEKKFRATLAQAIEIAASGENIAVMGIQPTRPESGYGYIEVGGRQPNGVWRVRRFTEKPNAADAARFVESGNYYWNSGMFIWSARTLASALREHLPATAPYLEEIAAAYGTRKFEKTFARLYPKCENISVDYAVLERRSAKGEQGSNIYCIPSDFGWNDLGSWAALYEHHTRSAAENVIESAGSMASDSQGNYVYAPGKFVAVIGARDLVVVETEDALLITTRERSQDVGKIPKHLEDRKKKELL